MFSLVLIYITLAAWTYWAYKKTTTSKDPTIPPLFEYSLPIIGHFHHVLFGDGAHLIFILEMIFNVVVRKGGGVYRAMMGPKALYMIADPDDCTAVSNSCASKPSFPYKFLDFYLGSGLLTSQEAHHWKACRKMLNPAFNQQMQDEFIHIFNSETRGVTEKLKTHVGAGPFDQMVYMCRLTMSNIVRTTLQISEDDNEAKNVIIEESSHLFRLASLRITNMWTFSNIIHRLTAEGREEKQRFDRLTKFTEKIINKKKIELKNDTLNQKPDRNPRSLLKILLELEDSKVFTRKDVTDQINTMIAAGFHTTAVMASFLLCAIGTYPKVQDRVYAEILEVFGTSQRDVEKEDLSKLIYIEAVIKETLRLYPVVPIVLRRGDTEVKLKEYTIPKDSWYVLLIAATNRLPIWGEDRDVFKPERWLDPATLPKNPNACSSFAIGRRACIGRAYSLNFLKVATVHILRQYKIKSNINKIQLRMDYVYRFHSSHEITIENRI